MCSAHTSSTARYWEVATGLARAARSQCVTTESALTPDSPPACFAKAAVSLSSRALLGLTGVHAG